ncbi:hypothetical protein JF546_16355 [Nitratireductor aquimarinus]|uniref:hypothetical protein n=1 Tax=Nitratireductor aquimarinus TaxID=889300 RepID=UPI001A8FF25C|nr:hypothetical protein [Nitratireductor aquimarinus]MBN8244591.1 hypothetical protein [Nitratireductor aquimarinus]MBY6132978.1 hypothetical protein [Nitratireductor aquimarinus]MCA1301820.1 hypothetical protein [Nitratireductor aquimarinus]
MATRRNPLSGRYFNSPGIASAMSNLASAFAPPGADEVLGWEKANAAREEASRLSALWEAAGDDFDRMGVAVGQWNPNQSFYAVDQSNATTRRGQDIDAAVAREKFAADNKRALAANAADNKRQAITSMYGALNPGQVAPAVPTEIMEHLGLPAIEERAGAPKLISESEQKALERQRLLESGLLTDEELADHIFAAGPLETVATPDGPRFVTRRDAVGQEPAAGAEGTAATQRIDRLAENLMATGDILDPYEARNVATAIADGRYKVDRHPVTKEMQVVDLATGEVLYGSGKTSADAPGVTSPTAAPQDSRFGAQYPGSQEAFGIEGALKGAINTAGDVAGVGAPYPDAQQTQGDFAVLRENLLNDAASAYNGRVPSWLLQNIRDLTPAAGSVFEGPTGAQSKLRALGRSFEQALQGVEQQLGSELSPQRRQELEARAVALQEGIGRVSGALNSFENPQPTPADGQAAQPADADGWTVRPNGVRIREIR